jgi:hypothetical protein
MTMASEPTLASTGTPRPTTSNSIVRPAMTNPMRPNGEDLSCEDFACGHG